VRSGRSIPSDIERELRVFSRLRESGVLARLDRLEAMPMGFRPTDSASPIFRDIRPEFKKAMKLARAMAALMRIEAAAGNHDRVVQIFGQMLHVARTVSHQPMIISCLVGTGIEAHALGEMRHLLQEADLNAAQCRLAIDLMNSRRLPTFELVAEAERIVLHDFAQHYFSDDGHGDGYILPSVAGGQMTRATGIAAIDNLLARFAFATRAQTVQTYDHYLDNAIAESLKPRKERWKSFDANAFANGLTWRYRLVQLLIPALTKVVDNQDYSALMHRATTIMLALQAYRAVHGQLPESLEQLVPEFLSELPVDPYNGKQLGYRRTAEDDHGRAYLLYSFGADGQDNQANVTSPKDWGPIKIDPVRVLSDDRFAGYDSIINTPRDEEPQ
jgi:type II secretory pathway pseudopilin PulG